MTSSPMTQRLTVLQRRLIKLLLVEGLPNLAAAARDAWLQGKLAPFTHGPAGKERDETVPNGLRQDFALANEHARKPLA
ncbi:MAG TPA: hypothetical protein VJO33_14785 [Gemmatimonadaceae bacterium]|nr:hypothetical protein [Gemmatimonadaceae bacterium]